MTSPGVVLIDEADIHLHVSWQQRLGFWLKEHFSNIQFLVTTHSPFICQAADPRGLIRLPAPGSKERVDHLSEELFKTVVQGGVDDTEIQESGEPSAAVESNQASGHRTLRAECFRPFRSGRLPRF